MEFTSREDKYSEYQQYVKHCQMRGGEVPTFENYWMLPKESRQIVGSIKDTNPEKSALKFDTGKLPLDLLDADAIEGLAAVLQFGAKKYAAHNWRAGFKWSRLIAALLRHTFAILRGERTDPESGLPHVDHIGCCWMFLSAHMKQKLGEDDLYVHSNPNQTQLQQTGNS